MNYKKEAEREINDFYKLESLKMDDNGRMSYPLAKQCALLHIEKILELESFLPKQELTCSIRYGSKEHYQHVLNEVKNS